MYLKNAVVAAAVAAFAGGAVSPAHATPLSGNFLVNLWEANNPSHSASDASQLATANNPLTSPGNPNTTYNVSGFSYSGLLNFSAATEASNTAAQFFGSAGGTTNVVLDNITGLSSSDFATVSLIEFTFTIDSTISGTITHDDGVGLYRHGTASPDLIMASAAAPTVATGVSYTIDPGTYDLFYVEANSAPAELKFDVTSGPTTTSVPEPMSAALLGGGVAALGLIRRARKTAPIA